MSKAKEKLDKLIEDAEKDCARIDKAVATLSGKGSNPDILLKKVLEQAKLWERQRTLWMVKGALGDI
jgi:hypothetical protein